MTSSLILTNEISGARAAVNQALGTGGSVGRSRDDDAKKVGKRGRFPYSAETWCRGTRQRSWAEREEDARDAASLEAWPLPLQCEDVV